MNRYRVALFALICAIGVVTTNPALVSVGVNGALQEGRVMEE